MAAGEPGDACDVDDRAAPLGCMARAASRMPRNTLRWMTPQAYSYSSSGIPAIGPSTPGIAALLTRTSSRPQRASTVLNASAKLSSLATSSFSNNVFWDLLL